MQLSAMTNRRLRKVRMDYSTLAQQLARDTDGILFDVHSLYARLLGLADRRGRHGRRYELALILVTIVLAKLAGEDHPSGIAAWARARQELFIEVFALKRPPMPAHNTYRRVLKRGVSLEDLEREVGAFLQAWPEVGSEMWITLDGKTVRGTIAFGETRGLHLLAAYLPGAGVVLFQVAVDTKTNEISAAPTSAENAGFAGQNREWRCNVCAAGVVVVDCRSPCGGPQGKRQGDGRRRLRLDRQRQSVSTQTGH